MERVFCVSARVLTKKKKREEKNSKSLSRCVTSRRTQERGGVTRRARTHHQYHRHPRERDDAIRVCDTTVTPRGRKERERSAKSKNEMIIGYGRTIFPHEIKKQISQPTIFPQKQREKVSLAPVVAVAVVVIVRLLLGGEDSRTRGERARFRVRGKGRHILTILFCVITREES